MNTSNDSTKMGDQGALQTSQGKSWLIMGGLLLAVTAFSFGLLIFTPDGKSTNTAIVSLCVIAAIYLLLVLSRFVISQRKLRLAIMATLMIVMVVVALIGLYISIVLES